MIAIRFYKDYNKLIIQFKAFEKEEVLTIDLY